MIVYVTGVQSLPKHFLGNVLAHYTAQGIDKFVFFVYGGRDNTKTWNELENECEFHNVELYEEHRHWNVALDSELKNELRKKLSPTDWIVPADFDEFHFHPDFDTFKLLAEAMDKEEAMYVSTLLIDRITEDGSIPMELFPSIPLVEQFPRSKPISKEVMGCYTKKVCMSKASLPILPGHHVMFYLHDKHKAFSNPAQTYHFKWFGNLREKEQIKIDMYKAQNAPWFKEQVKLFEYLDNNGGKL